MRWDYDPARRVWTRRDAATRWRVEWDGAAWRATRLDGALDLWKSHPYQSLKDAVAWMERHGLPSNIR